MSETLGMLLEMGFAQNLAEKAVKETGDKGIDAAMDWLMAHQDDDMSAEAPAPGPAAAAASGDAEMKDQADEQPDAPVAKSLKCDECGKLFKSSDEVELHAAKTGHSQFSESTEEKKPLTEEEKKEQLRKVEELMKQKRKEREEKEKADQLEREKKRIQSGKELTNIKKKLEDEELKKMADERRREKEEEKKARQRVKDMIEQDKLARKLKAEGASGVPVESQPKPIAVTSPASNNQPKEYKDARIQIRLTNGSTLTQSFGAKEQLAAVRLFIDMKRAETDGAGIPEGFRLQTNFPKKIFTDDEYEKPLDALGLVPSAVLIVSKM